MELQPRLVAPYLAALRAGLRAHAPNEDFVPLVDADRHLAALEPGLGGALLYPAEVDADDGLPHHNWLSRARAEAVLAAESDPGLLSAPDPSLGPEIVAQHQHRTSLHQHLRTGPLLPTARLVAHQRYAGSVSTFRVQFDHLLPGAGWMRIVADLSGALGAEDGLFRVEADDQVTVDEGLKHLFLRHGTTPLLVLMASLRSLMVVDLHRLSRSFIGPFWFPGCIPEAAPDVLQDALALHLFQEIVGQDVRHSAHRDPWVPPTVGVQAPQGYGLFRERRLAVPRGRVQAVQDWADGRGGAVVLGF